MTVLTWKDTDIPDFRDSMDGFKASSEMLSRAFDTAKATIGGIEKDQSEAAANAVLDKLLTYQGDPQKLEGDLASGAFQGQFDPKVMARLTPDMRKTLLERPQQLLAHAVKTTEFGEQKKAIAENDAARALGPKINEYTRLRTLADGGAAAAAYLEANPDLRNGLSSGRYSGMINGGQGIQTGETSLANSEEDRAIGQEADTLFQEATFNGGEGMAGERYLNNNGAEIVERLNKKGLNGQQIFNKAISRFQSGAAAAGGSGGGGSAPAFSGAAVDINLDQAQNDVADVLSKGGLSSHVVNGFLGNFHVEGGWSGKEGDDGSDNSRADRGRASGIAQWRKERRDAFAAKYGKQPHQATPAEQAQYVLWELTTAEGRKAAGISDDQANKILNAKSSGEAADLIDQFYERSNGKHRQKRVDAAYSYEKTRGAGLGANVLTQSAISGNQNSDMFRSFQDIWQSTDTSRAVAQRLTGKDGVFSGEDADNLTLKINLVMQKYGVSAAVAARGLEMSDDGKESWLKPSGWFESVNPWADGIERDFDEKKLDQLMKFASNPRAMADAANTLDKQTRSMAGSDAGDAAVKAAEADYVRERDNALARGRKFDEKYWGGRVAAAREAHTGAVRTNVRTAVGSQRQQGGTGGNGAAPAKQAAAPAKAAPKPTQPEARAVQFLESEWKSMEAALPDHAGPVQRAGLPAAFQKRFGISIEEARKDPKKAAEAVRKQHARVKAAQDRNEAALAAAAASAATNFRR